VLVREQDPAVNVIDEELTQVVIRHALEQHGYYFETINRNDGSRAEQLGRLGRAAAAELGVEVSMAAKPRRDNEVQLCMCVIRSPLTPEAA
jgi:hypothetical protein